MSKNRSTWSALLAVVLAMVVMTGLAITTFAVTDGGAGNESIPVVDNVDELTAVLAGTKQPSADINYDVDGNGIVENDDLVVLKYKKGEGEPLADAGDLLDQLTVESKGSLQSLVVKGDSTRALALNGGQSITLTFADPVSLSGKQNLRIDTLCAEAGVGTFQVVFLSGEKKTAPVSVEVDQGWNTVEVPLVALDSAVTASVTGIQITLAGDNTTYFDNFRAEGTLVRYNVSFEGMDETLEVVVGRPYGELPVPAKTFYTFEGWYYGEEKVTADTIVTAEAEHTLSAKFVLLTSDDGTVTVADNKNGTFGLTMDGNYRQIRFQFKLRSGDFALDYTDGDNNAFNDPLVTIVDANGKALHPSKVQPGQWYTAIIYGGTVVYDGAITAGEMSNSGTIAFAENTQVEIAYLETLTGQYGVRVLHSATGAKNPDCWTMVDLSDYGYSYGYHYDMHYTDLSNDGVTFKLYAGRYSKITFDMLVYEHSEYAAGELAGLHLMPAGATPNPVVTVRDMNGNQIDSAEMRVGQWYTVELDLVNVPSSGQYLYLNNYSDEVKPFKAYFANMNYVGDGEMIDNLSPATTVTVDKTGGDGTFVTTPVTRDTDRGTYRVAGTSANWYDRAIRVKLNDATKELIQLDFRFVTSKDGNGKDIAPSLMVSTALSGALTEAQYIIVDENDNPVVSLETGKWYRMFIGANGNKEFGLVPAPSGEVELQLQGIDTFNTEELPVEFGGIPVILTKFGKLEHVYTGNGTITVDATGFKQVSFAVKGATITGTGVTTEGSGEWKTVAVKNGGDDLGTVSLTISGNTSGMRIKDLAAYTEADPAKKTDSTIFRGLDNDQMMISGFFGPREEQHYGIYRMDQKTDPLASLATDDVFKLIADAGINYISDNGVDYSGSNKENAEHILRLAAKYGINYFASATDVVEIGIQTGTKMVTYQYRTREQIIYDSLIGSAADIKAKLAAMYQYESFGGLYLRDEPTADLFAKIREAVTKIDQAKSEMGNVTLNQYVNLLPWYNTSGALTNFQNYTSPSGGAASISNKAITWEEYLKASVLDTGMNYFSFDIYPFDVAGLNEDFLSFLGAAAKVSADTGKSWMGYAQVGGGYPSYDPEAYYGENPTGIRKANTTEAELNWDVNAMLAFGAKGILYYIGVTPPSFDLSGGQAAYELDPHSLIDGYGNTTEYYEYVKEINAQIQAMDHVLMMSEHLGIILNGNGACGYQNKVNGSNSINIMPQVSKSDVKLNSINGTALIGAFDYNGKTALLVMNNTTDNDGVADTITLTFDSVYTYEVIQDAKRSNPAGKNLTLSLLPGRCALVVVEEKLNVPSIQVSFDATNETVTAYEGYAYGELPTAQREGYAFGGWFTDETYTTQVTAETVVTNTAAHTLYAKWLKEYTVKFNLNYDGAGENPADIIVVEGNAYGDDLSVPVREGHTFLGWYVDTNYTRAVTANTVETESRTLYAKWCDVQLDPATSAITKTVTYTEAGPVFNFKAEGQVTAGNDQVLKMPLPEGAYRGFTMKVYFNECEQADGTNGVYIKPVSTNPNMAYLTPVWCDMDGNAVTNPQPKQWYKVVVTTEATNNLWLYLGNLATQTLNSLDISIKDIEGIPLDSKVVTINHNYTGGPVTSMFVADGATVGELPKPEREGHQFFGWFTSASGLTPVADSTAITADTTLVAFWNVDPAIWGGTFTYLGSTYGYYARVTAEELDGEPALKYTNQNIGGNTSVNADYRKVLFNVNAAAGDIISLKVKITALKGTSQTANTIAVYNGSGTTQLATTVTDVDTGTVVADGMLTVGKWYTISFVSDGSGKYQFRPFAGGGDDGTFYMKDIEVRNGSGLQGDSAVSLGAAIVDGEIVYNYKTSGTNTAQTRVLYFKNDGTHRALTYKIKFTESSHADYEGFKGYVRHYSGGAYMYPVVTDEAGKVIATDSASCAANIKPDVWYIVTLDAGEGNTLSSNIWTFIFDTDGKYDNATVEFEIKDIEYPDDVQTKHKVTYNLNYNGAPAAETFMIADGTTVGELPKPEREGHQFFGWFTSASGLTPVADSTAITADRSLYAFWNVDPAIWGGTFTYLGSTYGYYARVTAEELDGEPALKYTNQNIGGNTGVNADYRKVLFNVNAAAGDIISLKVKITALKGTSQTANTIAVYNGSGTTKLATTVTDVDTGTVVADGMLTVGKWYTISFISDGSGKYQFRPFAGGGDDGTIYMKDITVETLFNGITMTPNNAAFISGGVTVGAKGVEYNFKSLREVTAGDNQVVKIAMPADTYKGFVMQICFNTSVQADGTDGIYIRPVRVPDNHYLYYYWYDENGDTVAAADLKTQKWYTVVAVSRDATSVNNMWMYVGNLATQNLTSLDVSIAGVAGIPLGDVQATIDFNLNYEGAPAYGQTKSVSAYTTYGTLPTDITRTGYNFGGWYKDAACTKPVAGNTLVTESHTLYAKWNAAVSFTWNDNGYYATVAATGQVGEYKYTATNPTDGRWHSGVYAKYRKVMLNLDDTFGDTISMKVMLEYVKDVNGTSLDTSKMTVYASGAGDPLAVTFKDAEGKTVANDALVVGRWYTMTFTAVGAKCYEIHPFNAGGEKGDFYMKNIQTIPAEKAEDDFDPILRFAVTSDVHVYNYYGGNPMAKYNLGNLFNVAYGYANLSSYKNLNAVLVAGDISEGHVDEFETFKQIADSKLQTGTQLLVGMGNHDFRKDGGYTDAGALEMEAAFKEVFGLDSTDQHVVINGYHFIVLSPTAKNLGLRVGESYSAEKLAWLEAQIQQAVADDATKPVFVMQHHHASDTVYGSDYGDDKMEPHYAQLYEIFAKYPQVVDFSGHSHYPVNDPRNVWQDAFTAIGTGTLFYVGLDINGGPKEINIDDYLGNNDTPGAQNGEDYGMFQIVEVNADNDIRIIVYDLRTFTEQYRFVIKNPVDPANHVTNEEKAEASVVPEFAEGAEIEIKDVDGVKYVYVPQAVSTEIIESYRAKVTVNGVTTTYYGLSGYVYPNQPEYVSINIGQLDIDGDYRIEVVAVNAYGKESTRPLVVDAAAPKAEITFDLNYSGAPAAPATIQVIKGKAYGNKLPVPSTSRTGLSNYAYSFAGWYLNAECTGNPVKPSDVADQSRTLYAKWVAASFLPRAASSVYSQPISMYYGNDFVYMFEANGAASGNVESSRLNMFLPEAVVYAVSYKVMAKNDSDAAIIYTHNGNNATWIYDANMNCIFVTGRGGGAGTSIELTEGEWYTFVQAQYTGNYYTMATANGEFWGIGGFGDGTGNVDIYIKDVTAASSVPANDAADRVSFYSQSAAAGIANAISSPVLRWVDDEWMYVYEGSQNTDTEINGRQIGLYAYNNVYNVKFDLMMNNLNGGSIAAAILTDAGSYSTNFASYGIVYTIKDAQGNLVTDNFEAGEWYTIEMTGYDGGARTLDATGGNGDNWRLCTLGTGTGGLDVYIRNVEISTTPIV